MNKASLRRTCLETRRALTPEQRREGSSKIRARLRAFDPLEPARTVSLYAHVGAEVATDGIYADLHEAGKHVVFPRSGTRGLDLAAVDDWSELRPGPFGVLEPPSGAPSVAPEDVDTWLVPGVAFDVSGGRLGRGGGHYDRLLEQARSVALRVGVCFEVQVVIDLPKEQHDVPMDYVITEERLIKAADAAGSIV